MLTAVHPILAAGDLLDHVLPHNIWGTTWFNNHMLMALVSAAVVLLIFAHVSSRAKVKGEGVEAYITHGRLAQTFEAICGFLRDQVVRPALGPLTDKYIYYIWTVFFFILFANILGLIPFGQFFATAQGLITGDWVAANKTSHWGGTATGNLAVTGALALISFIMIVFVGVREQGVGYFKHFCPVEVTNVGMIPLAILLVFLEVLGLIIKCVVLAMRLFGNMLAGHLVIAALIGLIAAAGTFAASVGVGVLVMIGATAISLLELFVAMLQAFIFTFLTVLFIAAGAVHEHHEEHHDYDRDHEGELEHGVEPVAHVAGAPTAH